jgi:hypothetical protein
MEFGLKLQLEKGGNWEQESAMSLLKGPSLALTLME